MSGMIVYLLISSRANYQIADRRESRMVSSDGRILNSDRAWLWPGRIEEVVNGRHLARCIRNVFQCTVKAEAVLRPNLEGVRGTIISVTSACRRSPGTASSRRLAS